LNFAILPANPLTAMLKATAPCVACRPRAAATMLAHRCANQAKIVRAPLKITCGANDNSKMLSACPKLTKEPTRRSVLDNLRQFSIGIAAFVLAQVNRVGSASARGRPGGR